MKPDLSKTSNEDLFKLLRTFEAKLPRCKNPATIEQIKQRINDLKDMIYNRNLGLMYKAIRRAGVADDDSVLSECNLVFTRGIRRFNPALGYRFSTYIMNCLKHGIAQWSQNATNAKKHLSLDEKLLPDLQQEFERPDTRVEMLREVIAQNAAQLNERDLEILRLYFWEKWTYRKICKLYNVSPERIRQLKERAFDRIRTIMERRQIDEIICEMEESAA